MTSNPLPNMEPLCASLFTKADEQIERIRHLIDLLPEDRLDWQPPAANAWTPGILLGHLLECLAGFCAVFLAAEPERLAHYSDLRLLPVNLFCGKQEAIVRIAAYRVHIRQAFELLADASLARTIPTIFTPHGETLMTLLLGNLEHLINHKHQLFIYLRLLGVNVSSRDLYCFRGP
ncbi:MAG TPA: DinB family protein [Bryobacteraceae bacterium]|nr:DinB family protein [Bryobacteraceae bacterium]